MQPLDRDLRSQLEKTIIQARETAETGGQAALEQLGVGEAAPFPHLSEAERERRRRLRAHGRQLGDHRHPQKETQEIERLVEEVAYEHWHRMLFARFLAENDLLMYPDPDEPVAITLEECEDLAADEGARNGWELAARYASGMLPQIFRADSPALELALPPEHEQRLERLIAELPQAVFTASDALGWVYQFWQSARKDEINAAEVKIGERELPAVTQLFTEPYMVAFQLDNGLGAWWAARRLGEDDFRTAASEQELRNKAALPGVPLTYLRFVQQEDGTWTPAAGTFDQWPENLAEFRVMDPCCGSGHFLVAAFFMLVPMRMELEGLEARQAVDRVLAENLHGLEIDQRCVELAAFALALTAWRYPEAGGYRSLPELNLACSGLSVGVAKEEWKQLAPDRRNLRIGMDWLHETFSNAPVLGSLIDPARSDAAKVVEWSELEQTLQEALAANGHSDEEFEAGVAAQGVARAATLLAGQYHWVITNVPYLQRGKQSERLRDFCGSNYPAAKNDLATVFLERCLAFCGEEGTTSLVLPQNWLFLTSYKKLREKLLKQERWLLVARLGAGAFETISGEVVKGILLTLGRGSTESQDVEGLFGEEASGNLIRGLDVAEAPTARDKAAELVADEVKEVEQREQLGNPDAAVQFVEYEHTEFLSVIAYPYHGISTTDYAYFGKCYWELPAKTRKWVYQQTTIRETKHFSGKNNILLWEEGRGALKARQQTKAPVVITGLEAWEKCGIAVTQMRHLPVTIYTGNAFDDNTAVLVPKESKHLLPLWCFCSSPEYNRAVRALDQTLKVTYPTLVKVPFDLDYWTKVAEEQYPKGLPYPYSNDPTQWIFHGHPCGSVVWDEEAKWTAYGDKRTDDTVLQVAVARLLGYRWPAEYDPDMELAPEQREWVAACEALRPYTDNDGIVCIPPVGGEAAAGDRLLNLLAAAYGDDWSNDVLSRLLQSVDHGGKTLESWLRDKFFAQHCKLFQQRPFIWHLWDGLKDGFSVLVNYHKLGYKNLETLTYTYLGDWIARQKQDQDQGVDGAGERLAAAEQLQKRLELILEGEAPYDIFVRWKPLGEQPIGWNPDLNDGVRLNIRPFMTVEDVRKKGAGILRDKPNINWKKDRGRDVESAPWYHLGPQYGGKEGDRINDHHLSLADKQAARKQAEKGEAT
ncbi:restriction endonuclease subunit M [Halorhodospira halophila]|nr:restriction endonuclease subunit M [Halorhodospira halophila]